MQSVISPSLQTYGPIPTESWYQDRSVSRRHTLLIIFLLAINKKKGYIPKTMHGEELHSGGHIYILEWRRERGTVKAEILYSISNWTVPRTMENRNYMQVEMFCRVGTKRNHQLSIHLSSSCMGTSPCMEGGRGGGDPLVNWLLGYYHTCGIRMTLSLSGTSLKVKLVTFLIFLPATIIRRL